jgi:hypothetical protein
MLLAHACYSAHCNTYEYVCVAMPNKWVQHKKHCVEHNLFEIFEALRLPYV